jgi:RNA polymerase sigma-70 factor (ECF subfamily)
MAHLDKSSFEELFRQHYAALCRYAVGIIGDSEQSEDIVQHSFVKMWNKRADMDLSRSLKSYLYTSVRNACINYIRDQKKFRSEFLDIEIYASDAVSAFTDGLERVQAGELQEKIQKALAALPDKSREVFVMSRIEQMKYREIAEKLGVKQKTVEAHMSRALKILREELSDYLFLLLVVSFLNF